MKTIPMETPRDGVLAFNGRWLVRFGRDGYFCVMNGLWEGTYDGSDVLVHRTEEIIPSVDPFQEVTELTEDDRHVWHYKGPIVLPERPEDDGIPY